MLVGDGTPTWQLMLIFGVTGAIVRSAGCVVNDIIDRDLDARVARTASRPLAAGELSRRQAVACLAVLVLAGFVALAPAGMVSMALLAASWLLIAVYPLMKRLIACPQAWLAVTINTGVPVAWVAATGGVDLAAVLVYLGACCWTMAYDTIYAHQDKRDDRRIGVRSTALLFGAATRGFLAAFFGLMFVLLAAAGVVAGAHWVSLVLLLPAVAQAAWQVVTVDLDDPADCGRKFRSNILCGFLVLAAVAVGGRW